jgi:hypothetical protein
MERKREKRERGRRRGRNSQTRHSNFRMGVTRAFFKVINYKNLTTMREIKMEGEKRKEGGEGEGEGHGEKE